MILGHKKQWELLKKITESESFSHAFLFSGEEKLGKKKIALQWISTLFGEDVEKRLHPDFILVEPEKPDPDKAARVREEIQIGQIRDLIWRLSLKPYAAPLKAAIIDKAHSMNEEAQSSLLKTLEEPKGRTLLILITEYPERLFPTILSRVQTVKFFPVKKEEINNYLKKQEVSQSSSERIIESCWDRPGAAVDFLNSPEKLDDFQNKIKELIKISNSDLAFRFQCAKNLSENTQDLKEVLNIWLRYFRDILIKNLSQKPESSQQINRYSFTKLKKIINTIQNTIYWISSTNANPRLALEILMMEL